MRIADDLSDEPGSAESKVRQLSSWRSALRQALVGSYTHPSHPALHHTVTTFGVPPSYLEALIDGVEMDLTTTHYATFDELRKYCWSVASVVGLACLRIWGCRDEKAQDYAASAGIAFQLTNILRDLKEDVDRGRVYVPQEDLTRFGYDEGRLRQGVRDDAYRALMRFEVERARSFYDEAQPLAPLLPRPGRSVFLMMARTYRAILEAIERCDYDVFSRRVGVSAWKKFLLALGVLPVRWGWK